MQEVRTPMPLSDDSAGAAAASRWRPRLVGVVLLAVLGLAAGVVWLLAPPGERAAVAAGPDALALTLDQVLARSGAAQPPGLALRPFTAPEGDAEAAALGVSVCEAIGLRLARLPRLRVTPCTSTRVAVAAQLDDAALARLVVARWLLRGEIASRPAGRVHLRLALRSVSATGRVGSAEAGPVWTMDEELDIGELQALPRRLAQATSAALGQPLAGPETPSIAPPLYARYLRAVQLARVPDAVSRRQALGIIDEVLAAVPDHGPALYTRLALRIMGVASTARSADERRAEEAAIAQEIETLGSRLLREDPGNARAQVLLLNHAFKQRRWPEVFAHANAMVQHAHRQPFVLRIAARVHLYAGYVRRAGELALEAVRLDALDADSMEALALVHGVLGNDARMAEFAALARQLGHRGTGLQEMVLARRRGDAAALERAARDWAAYTGHPADWVGPFVRAAADARELPAARAAFASMSDAARYGMVGYFIERGLLGDAEGCLHALRQRAHEPPSRWVEQLWWPEFAAVRRDPAFAADVLTGLNLPELWALRGAPDLCRREGTGWVCR
jgi:TolB-like protein